MDLELLRTFLEVSRVRHFGRAADELSISQAAVSARIRQLETLLDTRLFDRSRPEVTLTPEGHRLLRHADKLIHAWRQACQEVGAGRPGRQIAIGGSLRLWEGVLQPWFERLRAQQPDLAIIAESQTPDLLVRRLLDGIVDVAFLLDPPELELLHIEPVQRLALELVSNRKGVPIEQALDDGYLMVDWGLACALEHRRLFPDAPEPLVRVGAPGIALGHIRRLGGAAYLPTRLIRADLAEGALFRVVGAPVIERTVHAAYPVRTSKADLIREVLSEFGEF